MADPFKLCPPYSGDEPFLYLCVSDADKRRVKPLLTRLFTRGCRVWYPLDANKSLAARSEHDARMRKAQLVVLFQTAHARADLALKSALLVCQAEGIPIISIDADRAESTLSMGLGPRVPHIRAKSAKEIESTLLRTEGFTQELIGTARRIRRPYFRRIAIAVFAAALVLLGAMLLYRQLHQPEIPSVPAPEDTVVFADPALREAVREAIGGGLLTEESVLAVETLRLSSLPADLNELGKLPNLFRIALDQNGADGADALLDRYEIVLIGGGA